MKKKSSSPRPLSSPSSQPISWYAQSWFPYSVILVLAAIAYGLTMSPLNTPFGDSDELITTALTNGIAHPPGYLLLLTILKFFSHLPLPLPIALKLPNLLFQLGTLLILYALSRNILQKLSLSVSFSPLQSNFLSALPSIILMFNQSFWLSALTVEKYPLLILLILSTVYLTLAVRSRIGRFATAFIIGIAMQYHPLTLFALPGLLLLYYQATPNRQILFWGLGGAILGFLSPQLLLFTVNPSHAPITIPIPSDFNSWLNFTTKQIYNAPGYVWGVNISQITPTTVWHGSMFYLTRLFVDFNWWPIPVSLYGLYTLHSKSYPYRRAITLLVICTGPILALINILPPQQFSDLYYEQLAITHRLYFLSQALIMITLMPGLVGLAEKFRPSHLSMFAISSLLIVSAIIFNFPSVKQHHLSTQISAAWFADLPSHAVLVCRSDFSCFNLFYRQAIERQRPDITIAVYDRTLFANYYNSQPSLTTFSYTHYPEQLTDSIVTQMGQGRRIFFTDLDPQFLNYLGVLGNPFFIVPYRSLFELTTSIPTIPPSEPPSSTTFDVVFPAYVPWNQYLYAKQQVESHTRYFLFAKYSFAAVTPPPAAVSRYQIPLLDPNPNLRFNPGANSPTAEAMYQQALNLQQSGQHPLACQLIRAASWRDLTNISIRQSLRDCYQFFNAKELINTETQNLQQLQSS